MKASNIIPKNVKAIKIVKCDDPLMWYANKIGHNIPLIREDIDGYWCREDAGYVNVVKKSDAVTI